MATVLEPDEIKNLVDIPQLIKDIEEGFVLYSEGRVKVPPVGFLHFDDPPGDVHIVMFTSSMVFLLVVIIMS